MTTNVRWRARWRARYGGLDGGHTGGRAGNPVVGSGHPTMVARHGV
ncbi:MAG: hypothetical protein V9E98_07320 [Candidatus Nanopelagicales bacterium]